MKTFRILLGFLVLLILGCTQISTPQRTLDEYLSEAGVVKDLSATYLGVKTHKKNGVLVVYKLYDNQESPHLCRAFSETYTLEHNKVKNDSVIFRNELVSILKKIDTNIKCSELHIDQYFNITNQLTHETILEIVNFIESNSLLVDKNKRLDGIEYENQLRTYKVRVVEKTNDEKGIMIDIDRVDDKLTVVRQYTFEDEVEHW